VRHPPVIITAALTGSRISREQTPHICMTPEEIAGEGIAAWRAGAAIIHVRDADGVGAQDEDAFRLVTEALPLRDRRDPVPHRQRNPRQEPAHG
jgi:3-keto-5-aminohexanoate cleavage enzyme